MANKKISELPYINVSEISGNTLVPLVTYFSAATGDTVHTYTSDLQNYIGGNYLPLTGGTVSGATGFLDSSGTIVSIDSNSRLLYDSTNSESIDWENRNLSDLSGSKSVDYANHQLNDSTTVTSVDWEDRSVYDNSGVVALQWSVTKRILTDITSAKSVDWGDRTLINTNGDIIFDWENGILTGQTNIESVTISATTYQNLPIGFTGAYLPLSGGTVTGGTVFTSGLTASTLNISTTPTTDTGTTTNYLTRDGSTGEVKVKTIPEPTVYGLFSQTGTSVAVSATTVESTLINNGIGTITVPANGFQVGDSFNGVLIGHLSCVGTATLQIRIKTITGVLLADTGVIAMETATNKHWKLDVNFTIRQLGVAGIGSIASGGLFSYTKNSGTNFEGTNFSIINNTTFDTTISNTLLVTAQWNTNNAGNSIYSEIFTLNKTY